MLTFKPYDVEGDEPVGDLSLGTLKVQGAYLDTWLDGILRSLIAILMGASAHEVDLLEESTPLRVHVTPEGATWTFENQVAFIGNPRIAARAITSDVRTLLLKYAIPNVALASQIIDEVSTLEELT